MSRSATHALLRLNKPFEGLSRDLRFAAFWGRGGGQVSFIIIIIIIII